MNGLLIKHPVQRGLLADVMEGYRTRVRIVHRLELRSHSNSDSGGVLHEAWCELEERATVDQGHARILQQLPSCHIGVVRVEMR